MGYFVYGSRAQGQNGWTAVSRTGRARFVRPAREPAGPAVDCPVGRQFAAGPDVFVDDRPAAGETGKQGWERPNL